MMYVLQVQTGKELAVRTELARKNITAHVPRERLLIRKSGLWSKMIKLLFPGYVFIETEFTAETFHEIKPISGVLRFLGDPTPLPEHEAEMIRWLSNGGEVIEPSEIAFDEVGKPVYSGFLAGFEDRIKYLNLRQKKARVEVRFGGKIHRANIGVTMSE